jgi:hypothetical protein
MKVLMKTLNKIIVKSKIGDYLFWIIFNKISAHTSGIEKII